MSQDFPLNHPFPYFGLRVTRDEAMIAKAIAEKYEIEKKFEYKQPDRWKMFGQNLNFIGKQGGRGTGNYQPLTDKINAIVNRCLQQLDPMLLAMAHPVTKTIHPIQKKHLLATATETFRIEESLADGHISELLKKHDIRIDEKVPPPPPPTQPQPVIGLHHELHNRCIKLVWTKPDKHCEHVLIRRSDWPAQRTETASGNEWSDVEVQPGVQYEYTISSVYGAAPPGGTNQRKITARGAVEDFCVQSQGQRVSLKWTPLPNTQSITILRSRSALATAIKPLTGEFQLPTGDVKQFDLTGNPGESSDPSSAPGETYSYLVVAKHRDQVCSASEWRSATVATPPQQPSNIKCEVYPNRIYLSWKLVSGQKVTYQIVCSTIAMLTGNSSQERSWKSTSPTFEDKDVESGQSYYYFIAAACEGLVSGSAQVGPVVAIGEVQGLKAFARSEQVELEWQAPPGVKRVDVLRALHKVPDHPDRRSSPPHPGVQVPVTSSGRLVDAGLTNDVPHYYRVMCVFSNAFGGEVITPGEAIFAVPSAPPGKLRTIRAAFAGGLSLTWENPDKYKVQVYQSAKRPPANLEGSIPLDLLKQFGEPLLDVSPTGLSLPQPNLPFYLIFSCNRHQAIYCGFALYWEIAELKVEREGSYLAVRWRWPPECKQAEIRHFITGPGGDLQETRQVVERTNNDAPALIAAQQAGQHRVEVQCLRPERSANVAIGPAQYAVVQVGGATRLEWQLLRPFRLIGRGTADRVRLNANGTLSGVRAIRFVAQAGNIPRSPQDGELLAEWSATDGFASGSQELPLRPWSGPPAQTIYGRIFVDPEPAVTVVHPPKFEDMQL